MKEFICPKCNKVFNKKSNYNYHVFKRKTSCMRNFKHKNISTNLKIKPKMAEKYNIHFLCPICFISFTRKDNLNRHTKSFHKLKKLPPENAEIMKIVNFPKIDTIGSVNESIININNTFNKGIKNLRTNEQGGKFVAQKKHKNALNLASRKSTINGYLCEYCEKTFTLKSSLCRHLKNYCKVLKTKRKEEEEKRLFLEKIESMKKENKEQRELILQLDEKITSIRNSLINYTMNNNINNINNNNLSSNKTINNIQNNIYKTNIKLVPFGKEDLSYISNEICSLILNKGFKSVPKLVEFVHFSNSNPKHHNVYISNMRDTYATIFNGKIWILHDRQDIINQLYDDKRLFLEDKFKELHEKLDHVTKKKFNRFIKTNDEFVSNNVKEDIKLLLYNKKYVPMKTKTQFIELK